jgi:diaminopimelate decarboxylase
MAVDSLRFLSPGGVVKCKESFGTPCYVYDAPTLTARAEEALAFPNAFGVTVRYAMKACPNAAVLRLFDALGLHFDASSTHEARRAMACGIAAGKISLSTQQLDDDFPGLVAEGMKVNACSLSQLASFGEAFPGAEVGVRFNPGVGSGGTSKTNVGGPSSSFGIWHEDFDEVVKIAAAHDLVIVRVHTHIGSGSDAAVWQKVSRMSLDLCERLGGSVHTLNLGGGYKVGRMAHEASTDLGVVGEPVKKEFEGYKERTGQGLALEVEPGTYLVANAGALVTTIQDVTSTKGEAAGNDFLKLDCGMTEVLRPSLYGAQHPLVVVKADGSLGDSHAPYVVVGHCCESGDLLTPAPDEPETLSTRDLATATKGDLMVVESVGAYCAAMSTAGYNSFPSAPEVLHDKDGNFHLIRKRSSLDQLIANEVPVDLGAL